MHVMVVESFQIDATQTDFVENLTIVFICRHLWADYANSTNVNLQ